MKLFLALLMVITSGLFIYDLFFPKNNIRKYTIIAYSGIIIGLLITSYNYFIEYFAG